MPLPNFLIVGVAKAGTTSLYRYLDQHPQVFMCPEKGSNFFGYEDARAWTFEGEGAAPLLQHFKVRTLDQYRALFAGVSDEIAIGEASPQYFRCPTAARRIHECIPDVKLVVSLRNPADRAFSGFLMRTRRGERVASAYDELASDSSHVQEGFYYRRLKRYYDIFESEQIKVIIFEEFKKDPARVVVDLLDFLGVDSNVVPDTSTRHNPAGVPRFRLLNRLFFNPTLIDTAKSVLPETLQAMARKIQQQNVAAPPTFPPDLRAGLLRLYRDDIRQLEGLLHRDLSSWLTGC